MSSGTINVDVHAITQYMHAFNRFYSLFYALMNLTSTHQVNVIYAERFSSTSTSSGRIFQFWNTRHNSQSFSPIRKSVRCKIIIALDSRKYVKKISENNSLQLKYWIVIFIFALQWNRDAHFVDRPSPSQLKFEKNRNSSWITSHCDRPVRLKGNRYAEGMKRMKLSLYHSITAIRFQSFAKLENYSSRMNTNTQGFTRKCDLNWTVHLSLDR